ncbi:MAG TPA: ABC transporter permease [Pseudonocardiaceae bacterium]|nr:ABC transporter permease [Pseudonocardiaceae bacterium]
MSAAPAPAGIAEAPVPSTEDRDELPVGRRRRRWLPYLLLLPGIAWLVLFFLVPILSSVSGSVQTGSLDTGFVLSWRWANYSDALTQYHDELLRSLLYSLLCTVGCLILAYPLTYFIALRAGRWKNLLIALVVVPSFTSFLIRTIAWKTILSDNGFVVHVLNVLHITNVLSAVGLTQGDHVLASPAAVVCGMIYNFLPFTVLPLYVSLEKINPGLLEAARDLYCTPFGTFRRVTLPLSMPGVVGGTLLTFIPAVGDYINAQLLGNPNTTVIGQKIEDLFLRNPLGYPLGSAISVVMMVVVLAIVMTYIRRAGTEDLL